MGCFTGTRSIFGSNEVSYPLRSGYPYKLREFNVAENPHALITYSEGYCVQYLVCGHYYGLSGER
jgi:hypothetical protein